MIDKVRRKINDAIPISLQQEMLELRRKIHEDPELSNNERYDKTLNWFEFVSGSFRYRMFHSARWSCFR